MLIYEISFFSFREKKIKKKAERKKERVNPKELQGRPDKTLTQTAETQFFHWLCQYWLPHKVL